MFPSLSWLCKSLAIKGQAISLLGIITNTLCAFSSTSISVSESLFFFVLVDFAGLRSGPVSS